MVIPLSFSSGALSIESNERNSERPFFANTVVIAAVKVAGRESDHVVCLFQQVKISVPPGLGPILRLSFVRDHADQSDVGTGRLLQQQR